MLGVLIGLLAIGGRRIDRRLAVLAFGVLCFWASDTIYLIKDAAGTWVSGGPFDPGWWTIAECAGIAAWMDPERALHRAAGPQRPRLDQDPRWRLPWWPSRYWSQGSFTAITLPAVVLASSRALLRSGPARADLRSASGDARQLTG